MLTESDLAYLLRAISCSILLVAGIHHVTKNIGIQQVFVRNRRSVSLILLVIGNIIEALSDIFASSILYQEGFKATNDGKFLPKRIADFTDASKELAKTWSVIVIFGMFLNLVGFIAMFGHLNEFLRAITNDTSPENEAPIVEYRFPVCTCFAFPICHIFLFQIAGYRIAFYFGFSFNCIQVGCITYLANKYQNRISSLLNVKEKKEHKVPILETIKFKLHLLFYTLVYIIVSCSLLIIDRVIYSKESDHKFLRDFTSALYSCGYLAGIFLPFVIFSCTAMKKYTVKEKEQLNG